MRLDFDGNADQEALGAALDAARAGEDRELAQQVRDTGEQAVRLLTGLWRLMRSHAADNRAFDAPVRDFSVVLGRLVDLLGPIHVVCVEGQVYVNDIRIRLDEKVGGAADLEEELEKHQCGGIHFDEVLDDRQIREMLRVLAGRPSDVKAVRGLSNRLHAAGLGAVRVSGLYKLKLTGEVAEAVHDVRDVPALLNRAASHVGETFAHVRTGRALNPLPVRRVVNELVDAWCSNEPATGIEVQTALVGTPPHPSPHARHAVRTCILSILVGNAIGLSRGPLSDLGVGAMFHDVGYHVPRPTLVGDDDTVPESHPGPVQVQQHAGAGARLLLRQRGFHAAKVKRLLVTLSHHRGLFAGPTLYGRIVCIADDYDTMTRARPSGPLFDPAEALERMQAVAGERYDPVLLQLLVNRLGRYPPGSSLRLRDGRVVVSASLCRGSEAFALPVCRVVASADGVAGAPGDRVDLAVAGEVEGPGSPRGPGQNAK